MPRRKSSASTTTPGNLSDNLDVDASCEQGKAKIGEALEAAAALPGADTVLIGPGQFLLPSAPSGIEAHYNSLTPDNPVVVRGAGSGQTHLTMGGTSGNEWGLAIQGPAASRIEDLSLTIPANADTASDWGLYLEGGAVASHLTIDGPAAYHASGATLADSDVELAPEKSYNTAVVTSNGGATIRDSKLVVGDADAGEGDNPVRGDGEREVPRQRSAPLPRSPPLPRQNRPLGPSRGGAVRRWLPRRRLRSGNRRRSQRQRPADPAVQAETRSRRASPNFPAPSHRAIGGKISEMLKNCKLFLASGALASRGG